MNDEPGIDTEESFISEPIKPGSGSFASAAMARGEPGLPAAFTWRGREYAVAQVLESWKSTGGDSWGGTERYVRKHWYRVRTTTGEIMTASLPQAGASLARDGRSSQCVRPATEKQGAAAPRIAVTAGGQTS